MPKDLPADALGRITNEVGRRLAGRKDDGDDETLPVFESSASPHPRPSQFWSSGYRIPGNDRDLK